VRRNTARTGHRRLRRATLAQIYELMRPWQESDVPVIDNSSLSVAQTVERLEALLVQHAPWPGDAGDRV
jgi:hypothetical protein